MPTASLETLDDAAPETLERSLAALPPLRPAVPEAALRVARRFLPWLWDTVTVPTRVALIATGFMPVTLIAATAFGVAGPRALALGLLAPAVALSLFGLTRRPGLSRMAAIALACGAPSTAPYDAYRFAFLA